LRSHGDQLLTSATVVVAASALMVAEAEGARAQKGPPRARSGRRRGEEEDEEFANRLNRGCFCAPRAAAERAQCIRRRRTRMGRVCARLTIDRERKR
jgi:hypothetical protein